MNHSLNQVMCLVSRNINSRSFAPVWTKSNSQILGKDLGVNAYLLSSIEDNKP